MLNTVASPGSVRPGRRGMRATRPERPRPRAGAAPAVQHALRRSRAAVAAGRHHVVDERDAARPRELACARRGSTRERAAHVGAPRAARARQRELLRRVLDAQQQRALGCAVRGARARAAPAPTPGCSRARARRAGASGTGSSRSGRAPARASTAATSRCASAAASIERAMELEGGDQPRPTDSRSRPRRGCVEAAAASRRQAPQTATPAGTSIAQRSQRGARCGEARRAVARRRGRPSRGRPRRACKPAAERCAWPTRRRAAGARASAQYTARPWPTRRSPRGAASRSRRRSRRRARYAWRRAVGRRGCTAKSRAAWPSGCR